MPLISVCHSLIKMEHITNLGSVYTNNFSNKKLYFKIQIMLYLFQKQKNITIDLGMGNTELYQLLFTIVINLNLTIKQLISITKMIILDILEDTFQERDLKYLFCLLSNLEKKM